jgi:hypothetical protein
MHIKLDSFFVFYHNSLRSKYMKFGNQPTLKGTVSGDEFLWPIKKAKSVLSVYALVFFRLYC